MLSAGLYRYAKDGSSQHRGLQSRLAARCGPVSRYMQLLLSILAAAHLGREELLPELCVVVGVTSPTAATGAIVVGRGAM